LPPGSEKIEKCNKGFIFLIYFPCLKMGFFERNFERSLIRSHFSRRQRIQKDANCFPIE